MSKFTEYIGSQFGNPRGFVGKICCVIMNVINRAMYIKTAAIVENDLCHKVLDIGYGNGYLLRRLDKSQKLDLYGIDISKDMLEVATKRNEKAQKQGRLHLEVGDCCNLRYEDGSFDVVTSINTVYFWEDTVKGLSEIKRVLASNGYFINVVYTKEWLDKHKVAAEVLASVFGVLTTAIGAFAAAQAIATAGGLAEVASLAATAIGVGALTVAETVGTAATTAFSTALAFLTSPVTLVVAAIAALIAIIVLLVKHWDEVKEFGAKCWEGIKNAWNGADKWFKTNVEEPIKKYFDDLWNGIKKKALDAWNDLKNTWQVAKDWFNTNVTKPITDTFTKFWSGLKTKASDAWSGVKNTWNKATSFFSGIWDAISKKVSSVWGTIKKTISNVFDGIKNSWNGLTKFTNGVVDGIRGAFDSLVSKVKSAVNKVTGGINSAIDIINKIPGVSIGKIPALATGGILKRGQVGLLEGNGAEAVVPLERNKYWIGKVVEELKKQLDVSALINDLKSSGAANSLSSAINNAKNNVNNYTQIINAPKQPSRAELYRQTRNLLALKGGN